MKQYRVVYTKTAFADIKKLDTVVKKRLKKKIETYVKNPFVFGQKLINSSIGSYRWRIGNYRVIFDVDKDNIIILRVEHRKEIYQ